MNNIIYQPATTVVAVMNNLPNQMKIYPIPPARANKKAFLKIMKNASLQEIQKFLP